MTPLTWVKYQTTDSDTSTAITTDSAKRIHAKMLREIEDTWLDNSRFYSHRWVDSSTIGTASTATCRGYALGGLTSSWLENGYFTSTCSTSSYVDYFNRDLWQRATTTPKQRLQEIMRNRLAPAIHGRTPLSYATDIREQCARETLRRVIGDEKFRNFIRNGFISVRAKSGLVYQIFPAHNRTNVYKSGDLIELLCVVLIGNFPPTDSLIMRYLLILNDETEFRNLAIKSTPASYQRSAAVAIDLRPLSDIMADLRSAA